MKKRALSLLLGLTLVVTTLVGCGGTEAEESTAVQKTEETDVQPSSEVSSDTAEPEATVDGRISEETITLTISGENSNAENPWNDTIQFAEYEERLGIKLDATTYTSDQWETKFSLMLASDELPDIITNSKMTAQQVAEYGAEGYFLDLAEYLDVMPNFVAFMEEKPDFKAAITDEAGHIYALPLRTGDKHPLGMFSPTYLRTEWLENVGKEMPTNLDELYDVLVAFKEQDANGNGDATDEIPFLYSANIGNNNAELLLKWSHGIYSTEKIFDLIVNDGKVELGNATENYKDLMKYMNKLYSEELINQDAFVMTGTEFNNAIASGIVGFVGTGGSLKKSVGDQNPADYYTILPSFPTEYNSESVLLLNNSVSAQYDFAVSAATEYPEEIAKFIDYLFTEEGFLSSRFGYEGVTFDWKEIAGINTVDQTPYAEKWTGSNSWDFHVRVVNALQLIDMDLGGSYEVLGEVSDELLESEEVREIVGQNWLREKLIRTGVKTVAGYPNLKYTDEELKERATLYTDIFAYLETSKAEFISGTKDIDATWDSYLADLEKMGLNRLLEIEQAAYDRYAAAK